MDVCESGARLEINTSVEGLNLSEFFLLLSSTGLAYRRCELDRAKGRPASRQVPATAQQAQGKE